MLTKEQRLARAALTELDTDPRFNEMRLLGRMVARLNQIVLGTMDKSAYRDLQQWLRAGGFTDDEIERYADSAMVVNKAFACAGGNGPDPTTETRQ